jgi:hypothetical protein
MLVPSSSLRPLWICTAGDKTPSSPLSSNLTAKIASLSVKDLTSLGSNLTKPTPETLMRVSTCTPLLSALRNTNPRELATSPELITPPSSLFSPTPPLRVPRLQGPCLCYQLQRVENYEWYGRARVFQLSELLRFIVSEYSVYFNN